MATQWLTLVASVRLFVNGLRQRVEPIAYAVTSRPVSTSTTFCVLDRIGGEVRVAHITAAGIEGRWVGFG